MNINLHIQKIISIIFSRWFYASVFAFFCFIKNTLPINIKTTFLSYTIIIYGIFVYLHRIFRYKKIIRYKYEIILYLLLLSSILSAIINRTIICYGSLIVIISFFIFFIVCFIDDSNSNYESLKSIYYFSVVLSILFCLYTILSLIEFPLSGFANSRPTGLIHEATYFAQSIIACIGCSLFCYYYTQNSKFKKFLVINIAIQFIALLLNPQRGSFYGAIIALFIVCILYFNYDIKFKIKIKNNWTKLLLIIIATILIILIPQIIINGNIDFIITKFIQGTGREIIHKFGFESLLYHKNFIFGASRGGIIDEWNEYLSTKNIDWQLWLKTEKKIHYGCITQAAIHSTVLEQLFEHGIIGLLLLLFLYAFISFCFYHLFIFIKTKKNNEALEEKRIFGLIVASSFVIFTTMFDSFFNRALFFDLVYVQNLAFCIYSGTLIYIYVKFNN